MHTLLSILQLFAAALGLIWLIGAVALCFEVRRDEDADRVDWFLALMWLPILLIMPAHRPALWLKQKFSRLIRGRDL
jgi:hypothetical protein